MEQSGQTEVKPSTELLPTYALTSLQIGDKPAYLSILSIHVAREAGKLIFFVDNSPWSSSMQRSKSARLWHMMTTRSRLSPFSNRKEMDRVHKKARLLEEEELARSSLPRSLSQWADRQPSPSRYRRSLKWRTLATSIRRLHARRRALARLQAPPNGLSGCVTFEVEWADVWGIGYNNDLQVDTSLALEVRKVIKREFNNLPKAHAAHRQLLGGVAGPPLAPPPAYDGLGGPLPGSESMPELQHLLSVAAPPAPACRAAQDGQGTGALTGSDSMPAMLPSCMPKPSPGVPEPALRMPDVSSVGGGMLRPASLKSFASGLDGGMGVRVGTGAGSLGRSSSEAGVAELLRQDSFRSTAGAGPAEDLLQGQGWTEREDRSAGPPQIELPRRGRARLWLDVEEATRSGVGSGSASSNGGGNGSAQGQGGSRGSGGGAHGLGMEGQGVILSGAGKPEGEGDDGWGLLQWGARLGGISRGSSAAASEEAFLSPDGAGAAFEAGARWADGAAGPAFDSEEQRCAVSASSPYSIHESPRNHFAARVDISGAAAVAAAAAAAREEAEEATPSSSEGREPSPSQPRFCVHLESEDEGSSVGWETESALELPRDLHSAQQLCSFDKGRPPGGTCAAPHEGEEEQEQQQRWRVARSRSVFSLAADSDNDGQERLQSSSSSSSTLASGHSGHGESSGSPRGAPSPFPSPSAAAWQASQEVAGPDPDLNLDPDPDAPAGEGEGEGEGPPAIAATYHNVLLISKFRDPLLPLELQATITPDQRLLKMLEAGLPAWALFCQSWPLTSRLYRPWMRPLSRYVYFAISVATLLIGFYDLYKNVPVLREAVACVLGPSFEWVASWALSSRLQYLGTMLVLENLQRALKGAAAFLRSLRHLVAFMLKPAEGPLSALLDALLPAWQLLEWGVQGVGASLGVLAWKLAWAVQALGGSAWMVVVALLTPLLSVVCLLWTVAWGLLRPLLTGLWVVLTLPVQLAVALCTSVAAALQELWLLLQAAWDSFRAAVVLVWAARKPVSRTLQVAKEASPPLSTWGRLWTDIFHKVFFSLHKVLNSLVAFSVACNRHRLSTYNYWMAQWSSVRARTLQVVAGPAHGAATLLKTRIASAVPSSCASSAPVSPTAERPPRSSSSTREERSLCPEPSPHAWDTSPLDKSAREQLRNSMSVALLDPVVYGKDKAD